MNAYAVGGTIRATFTLAGELAKRHDVEIVSVLRTSDEPALALDPAVRLRPLTDGRQKRRSRRIERALAKPSRLIHPDDRRYDDFDLRSDVNLLRFLRSVRDGALIGTRPGINLALARFGRRSAVRVGQDHLNFNHYEEGLKRAIGIGYRDLDAVTALTSRTAGKYRKRLPEHVRVEAIPNGVRNTSGQRAALDAKVVVAAGRLTRQKAFHRLLPVWADVVSEHPDWELRIFGKGLREPDLEVQIRELGLDGRARLMGYTDRLPAELAAASLYVMTSQFEGFPMVLLEAMSVGLPVVAFDCPTGPAEVVSQGVDGYVVPNRDAEALAAAMKELMEDPEKRRAFGAAAVEKAAQYDPAVIAERFEALLEELRAAKSSRLGRPKRALNTRLRRLTGYRW